MRNFFAQPFVVPSIIIGIALFFGLWLVGWGISARNQNNTIASTGSATQDVKADVVKWSITVSRPAVEGNVQQVEGQVVRDAKAVESYLANQKLASSTVTVSTVSADIDYSKQNPNFAGPTNYTVRQTVMLQTSDVDTVSALSKDPSQLNQVAPGSLVMPQPPEYYVSNLPQLRVALIGQAVTDAKARAQEMAKSGGSSVGALQSADSGIVQVLAPNSTGDTSGYGSYDTSTIDKQVMVTAHVVFYVK